VVIAEIAADEMSLNELIFSALLYQYLAGEENRLKAKLLEALENQGFVINGQNFELPNDSKDCYKHAQLASKAERTLEHQRFIRENAGLIRTTSIDGNDLDPTRIDPTLILVEEGTRWEKIFRWWNLTWWSLPYERSYGRQIRFVVWDDYHQAAIGLIGLQSPILNWSVRDKHLGITAERRDYWANQSLSAQRIGALPPYNQLLGGKLVSLMLSSDRVPEVYSEKYAGRITEIRGRELPSDLLFITTTGAFGKSSIYNRLNYHDEKIAEFIGYTQGSGSFHIPNSLFEEFIEFLNLKGIDTRRGYGAGPSRKMKLINKALDLIGIKNGVDHGIKRAAYLIPYVRNLTEVIAGHEEPVRCNRQLDELTEYWKSRWCMPRSNRDRQYQTFKKEIHISDTLAYVESVIINQHE
jgi:hypothetical protein